MTIDALNVLVDKKDNFDILSATEEGAGIVNLTLQFYDYNTLEEFLQKINQEYVETF